MKRAPGESETRPADGPALGDAPAGARVTAERVIHQGFRRLVDLRVSVPQDGSAITFSREVLAVGRVAAVLPYDAARDRLVLLRQYRVGPTLAGLPDSMIEVVAGLVEPGETSAETAARETLEEAGVPALELLEALTFQPSPGFSSETATLYLARVDATAVPARTGLATENEWIETVVVAPEAALAALDAGRIANGFTVIALLWFARRRDEIRRLWLTD